MVHGHIYTVGKDILRMCLSTVCILRLVRRKHASHWKGLYDVLRTACSLVCGSTVGPLSARKDFYVVCMSEFSHPTETLDFFFLERPQCTYRCARGVSV